MILVLIAGALFLGWQYYAGRPSVQAARALRSAQEAYEKGDYGAAASSAEAVLKIDGSNADACNIMIDSYARQGSYAAMVTAYTDLEARLASSDAQALRSKVTGYLNDAAQSAENAGEYDTAIQYYDDVVSIAGDETDLAEPAREAIASLREDEARNADGASAIDAWKEVLKTDPDNVEAWTALAKEYEDDGDTADAETAYEKLIDLDPGTASYYESLADVYAGAGDYDKAIDALEKGYQTTSDASLSSRITEISLQQARSATGEKAVSLWKQIIKDNPRLVDAYSSLADVYISEDDQGEALKILQQGAKATGDALLQQRVVVLQKEMEQQGITDDDIDGNLAQQLYLALQDNRYNRAVRIMARKEFQDLLTKKISDAGDSGKITIDSSDFDTPVTGEDAEDASSQATDGEKAAGEGGSSGKSTKSGKGQSGKASSDQKTSASGDSSQEKRDPDKAESESSEDAEGASAGEAGEEETYAVSLTLDKDQHAAVAAAADGTRIVGCWPAQTDELGRVVIGEYGEDENGYGTYVLADGSELSAAAYFASFAP